MVLCLQQDGWGLLQDGGGELGKGVIKTYSIQILNLPTWHQYGPYCLMCYNCEAISNSYNTDQNVVY